MHGCPIPTLLPPLPQTPGLCPLPKLLPPRAVATRADLSPRTQKTSLLTPPKVIGLEPQGEALAPRAARCGVGTAASPKAGALWGQVINGPAPGLSPALPCPSSVIIPGSICN